MFARAYFPGRSGQIFVVPKEGRFVVSRDPPFAAVREDLHAAIDDAFATANRIAEDHLKKLRERRRSAPLSPAPAGR